jgi:hypothetical protein
MVEMSNAGKAECIVALLTRELEIAASQHICAVADLAKAETGKALWDKHEEEQGNIGWSQAPYNVESARARVTTTLAEKMTRKEVLDYAIEVFISKIPDKKES